MTGGEPIVTADLNRIVDSKGRVSVVTTAGAAPSLGCYLLLAYLPTEMATVGNTDLQVMYMNEFYPVEVIVAGATPAFDPADTRLKS